MEEGMLREEQGVIAAQNGYMSPVGTPGVSCPLIDFCFFFLLRPDVGKEE